MKTTIGRYAQLLAISLFLQLLSTCQAQEKDNKWHLSAGVNPAALLDPLYPTAQPFLQLGKSRFTFTYTHGFLYRLIFQSHIPDSAVFRVEKNKWAIRYALHNKSGSYFGQLELLQGYYRQKLWRGGYLGAGRDGVDFDYAYNTRRVWAISITNGVIAPLSGRLDLEISESFGVRVINNRFDDVINPVPFKRGVEDISAGIPNMTIGKRVAPHIMINTSLCYRIF